MRAPAYCDRSPRAQRTRLLEQCVLALETGIQVLQGYQPLQEWQDEFAICQQETKLHTAIGALEQYQQLAKNLGEIKHPQSGSSLRQR